LCSTRRPARQDLVSSRSLLFASPAGANAFLEYVHARAQQWYGIGTEVTALMSAGRDGWLLEPPQCSCHLATPLLVGVVQDGAHLAWLEISGRGATAAGLTALLAPDSSTTS
jgi:hypothetical protein